MTSPYNARAAITETLMDLEIEVFNVNLDYRARKIAALRHTAKTAERRTWDLSPRAIHFRDMSGVVVYAEWA